MAAIIITDFQDFHDAQNKLFKLEKLLGKDAQNLLEACKMLMDDKLYHPRHPVNPALKHIQADANYMDMSMLEYIHAIGMTPQEAVKAYMDELEEEEKKAYANDLETEKIFRNHLFKVVYGIASRKHIHITWLGSSPVYMPDRFEIYQHGVRIGMIQC